MSLQIQEKIKSVKRVRMVLDVSFLKGVATEKEIMDLLSAALHKKMMIGDLSCGQKVSGFSMNFENIFNA
jgi:hypothetical protein